MGRNFINTTRLYLKNYNKFKTAIINLNDDIEALEAELRENEPTAPIAKYGDEPTGGSNELTVVEQYAARREACYDKIIETKKNIASLKRIIKKIDRALDCMDYTDSEIIKEYYFKRKTWREIGQKYYFTEQWARTRGNKAIKQIAEMMFGFEAMPEQLKLKFIFSL